MKGEVFRHPRGKCSNLIYLLVEFISSGFALRARMILAATERLPNEQHSVDDAARRR